MTRWCLAHYRIRDSGRERMAFPFNVPRTVISLSGCVCLHSYSVALGCGSCYNLIYIRDLVCLGNTCFGFYCVCVCVCVCVLCVCVL